MITDDPTTWLVLSALSGTGFFIMTWLSHRGTLKTDSLWVGASTMALCLGGLVLIMPMLAIWGLIQGVSDCVEKK